MGELLRCKGGGPRPRPGSDHINWRSNCISLPMAFDAGIGVWEVHDRIFILCAPAMGACIEGTYVSWIGSTGRLHGLGRRTRDAWSTRPLAVVWAGRPHLLQPRPATAAGCATIA